VKGRWEGVKLDMRRLRFLRVLSVLAIVIVASVTLGTLLPAVLRARSLAGILQVRRTPPGLEATRFPLAFAIGATLLLALAIFGRPLAAIVESGNTDVRAYRAVVRRAMLLLGLLAVMIAIRVGIVAALLVRLRTLRLPPAVASTLRPPLSLSLLIGLAAVICLITLLVRRGKHAGAGAGGGVDIRRRDAQIIRELREREPLTVQHIVAQLDAWKPSFLDEVETAVKSYIAAQGKDCLTIVERGSDGSIYKTWELSASPAYVGRLVHFMRNETVDGHILDSGLTDPVMAVVTGKFRDLHRETGEIVASELLSSDLVAGCLADNIVRSHAVQYVGRRVGAKAADLVVHHLRMVVENHTMISAAAVGTLAAQVAVLLYQHFASAINVLMIQALHSAAVQHVLFIVGKKYLLLVVLPGMVKALLAKIGIKVAAHSVHAAATALLVPIIAGFIIRDIYRFPRDLGEKVAKQVRDALDGQYTQTNHQIAESLYAGVVQTLADAGVDDFMRGVLQTPEIDSQLSELCTSLAEIH
jgi:hypothetical protein